MNFQTPSTLCTVAPDRKQNRRSLLLPLPGPPSGVQLSSWLPRLGQQLGLARTCLTQREPGTVCSGSGSLGLRLHPWCWPTLLDMTTVGCPFSRLCRRGWPACRIQPSITFWLFFFLTTARETVCSGPLQNTFDDPCCVVAHRVNVPQSVPSAAREQAPRFQGRALLSGLSSSARLLVEQAC